MEDLLEGYYKYLESEDSRAFVRQQLEQEQLPDSSSIDALKAAYARAEREGGPGRMAYLRTALEAMQGGAALAKEPGPGKTSEMLANKLLNKYGQALGCPGFAEKTPWNRNRMAPALAAYLEAHPDAPPPPPELVGTMHEELLSSLHRKQVSGWVYNHKKRNKRMRIELKLFAAYLSQYPQLRNRWMTGKEIEEAQRLFDALQKEEYQDVLIPVMVVPNTFAGIFFVGVRHLNAGVRVTRRKDRYNWCRIVVLYPREFSHRRDDGEMDPPQGSGDHTTRIDQVIWSSTRGELVEWYGRFTRVDTAVGWLKHNMSELLELFEPSEPAPAGCPPAYKKYFTAAKELPGKKDELGKKDREAYEAGVPAYGRDEEERRKERRRQEAERKKDMRRKGPS